MPLVTLATCNLDQWSLDFKGNTKRILESIEQAKRLGATYRVGPELEITGYGCEDHFLEMDTFLHAWDCIIEILKTDATVNMICDIGMPVLHNGVRYNCRVFCFNRKIILIRPKLCLADDGNYRESRWFTPWSESKFGRLEVHTLPMAVRRATGQDSCPIGIGVIATRDATIASETCEELFTPKSPHIALCLDGVDIISNGSGSHHQLRKLHTRVDLMREASGKAGGVYMYANQQGCDGGRLYFDGGALMFVNGECVGQASQFSLRDVEVIAATVELDDVRSFRGAIASRNAQAAAQPSAPRVHIDFTMAVPSVCAAPTAPRPVAYHSVEEEIGMGPACWLWDYLRRCGAAGFFLPLSGGADSAASCTIVGVMCELVLAEVKAGNATVLADLRGIVSEPDFVPETRQDISSRMMHTCYMGTSNSGKATQRRAEDLAKQIGVYHCYANLDAMIASIITVFVAITASLLGKPKVPRFTSQGGTMSEDLALQNIQSRSRMVLAYMLSQLLPWVRGRSGWLLNLASANVDESLRGYFTKYDCSSADLNPIGSFSKTDLKSFLQHAAVKYHLPALTDIVCAPPTAELRPILNKSAHASATTGMETFAAHQQPDAASSATTSTSASGSSSEADGRPGSQDGSGAGEHSQLDEDEMGMSYAELSWFGRLRKVDRSGPVTMYKKLLNAGGQWAKLSPSEVAVKVKRFFHSHALNRHKMTTLTPSYHAESYSPDDNRFDLRPFLYPLKWEAQFTAIDDDVKARGAVE